ncbi:MAG TPA: SDR family oxidoreductase [Candidatus Acidoferrales bacterium]|nr:SDR family oxidoreductase [Candidatus Acidoferrales bacterium]
MRVFVTGASGFIGTPLTAELIGAGHEVIGLARSDASAEALAAAGADVHPGSLGDIESLRSGVAKADAVIHLAFIHDFSKFLENCETDRRAIDAMGDALAGSDRPLLVTSGTGVSTGGVSRTERDPGQPSSQFPRGASEEAADAVAARGVRVSVVRLPQVHNPLRQGLVSYLIAVAKERGVSAYVGDGTNRWPAVHVVNAAHLYRLALEKKAEPGTRYHAVAEEGVPLRAIAEAVGRRLGVPVRSIAPQEAEAYFGWLTHFVQADLPASSVLTRERLGWNPMGPGLIADLDRVRELAEVKR